MVPQTACSKYSQRLEMLCAHSNPPTHTGKQQNLLKIRCLWGLLNATPIVASEPAYFFLLPSSSEPDPVSANHGNTKFEFRRFQTLTSVVSKVDPRACRRYNHDHLLIEQQAGTPPSLTTAVS
jgi:hypothetical protein